MESEKSSFVNEMSEIWRKMQVKVKNIKTKICKTGIESNVFWVEKHFLYNEIFLICL